MKLVDISVKRPVLATVMVAVLVVFGVSAYPTIGVDQFPDVEFPFVAVTAVYPGADPETIESKVTDKLEEAINTVAGIKMLRSTSSENVSIVFVQFELERDADQAVQDVRDKISGVLSQLPSDLEAPIVQKFDPGAAPIMSVSVVGDLDRRALTKLADDVVKERLQGINGVGGLDIIGGQDREFHVWLDPAALQSYGLAPSDVVMTLASQNVEIPGGRLDVGNQELVVKTQGQVHTTEDLGNIVVMKAGGAPVRIRDFATVEDGVEEQRSHSEIDGTAAVSLVIRKQSGSNTVEVAGRVREAIEELRTAMPASVVLSVPTDNSVFIENSINDVKFDLLFGALLAIIIIMIFLHDWRATFISALALPTSVVATFAFIAVMGFTFNTMTMLALTLSIGILIDDAIVVIENIHRHLGLGKSAMEAARDGAGEIGLAVMATTASIIAVFVPVAIMKGIIGRFFFQFGLTVAFAVAVSLFVAFTLTPMASARLLRHGTKSGLLGRAIDRSLDGVDFVYLKILGAALRHKVITVLLATAALVAAGVMVQHVPNEFLPPEDRGQFQVTAELPVGTNLETTRAYLEEMGAELRDVEGVAQTFTTLGGGTQGQVNIGTIQVNLVPRHARAFSQEEAIKYARTLFAGRQGALISIAKIDAVGGNSAGMRSALIQYNIRGSDFATLNTSANILIERMRDSGGYVDIDTTYRGGKPEARVTIDRERAADLGVPIAAIAMAIRTFVAGAKATEIVTGGQRYDVQVRLGARYRRSLQALSDLKVRARSGQLIPLANVVDVSLGEGPSAIDHQGRQRQVTVLANLDGKPLGDAVTELDGWAAELLDPSISTEIAGMGQIMGDSFKYMLQALLLAIVLIYLILAAQFESLIHPFTIMLSLPLSFVGAIGALLLSGMTMNIFTMIGIIMLMGLVTKNAILLVDYTNTLRSSGRARREALLEAGPVRLRPILMTTAAMIFGMLPVALAMSEGGEQRAPMAVTVIGGLLASTLLTLVVVPVAYEILDGLGEWLGSLFGSRKGPHDPAEET